MIAFSRICLSVFVGLLYCATWNGQAPAQNDAAKLLSSKGELRAALIASNPVLVTRGADGQLGGVSVELARALAAKLGIPVRLMPYENPARYNESLGRDEWDIGLAARDPSRAEHLVFSDVFMEVDNGYGRFNLVQMSIAVPKNNALALSIVNEFVRDAKRDGLIAQAIVRAGLRGVRAAP